MIIYSDTAKRVIMLEFTVSREKTWAKATNGRLQNNTNVGFGRISAIRLTLDAQVLLGANFARFGVMDSEKTRLFSQYQ